MFYKWPELYNFEISGILNELVELLDLNQAVSDESVKVGVSVSKSSTIDIFNKQCLLSIGMKTKVVQHVPRITNLTHMVPSFCQTFRHFLHSHRLFSYEPTL